MRDSALKRTLVGAYFNALEVGHAVAGMVRAPAFGRIVENYDDYWRHRAPGGLQPRFLIIEAGVARGSSVLDVGCGDGAMLEFLRARKDVKAVGVDISGEAVSRARHRGLDARVQTTADLRLASDPFDHVIMSEVVEHVADAERFVLDAWRSRADRSG